MHLAQLYTQIKMQVVNQQYALANDRAQVQSFNRSAETTHSRAWMRNRRSCAWARRPLRTCCCKQRNLAMAENNLITANLTYAKDRALLYAVLASTLQHYGINLNEAATGKVAATPVVPGLLPAKNTNVAPTGARPQRN